MGNTSSTNSASSSGHLGIIGELVQNGRLAWRLLFDRRVPSLLKFVIPGVMGAYLLMPVDLLPDFVPVLGQLDDLAVLVLAMRMFIQLSPQPVVEELRRALMTGSPSPKASGPEGEVVDGDYRVVD